MPQQRAGVLSAAATVHVGEYAVLCLFLPGMMPSAPPVYPLDAIPLETVDRSSDALQLHELASAWTVCQTAARCFVVLLFANGISPVQKRGCHSDRTPGMKLVGTLHDFHKLRAAVRIACSCVYAECNDARTGRELDQCGVQQESVATTDFTGTKPSTLVSHATPRCAQTAANLRHRLSFGLHSWLAIVHK